MSVSLEERRSNAIWNPIWESGHPLRKDLTHRSSSICMGGCTQSRLFEDARTFRQQQRRFVSRVHEHQQKDHRLSCSRASGSFYASRHAAQDVAITMCSLHGRPSKNITHTDTHGALDYMKSVIRQAMLLTHKARACCSKCCNFAPMQAWPMACKVCQSARELRRTKLSTVSVWH